MACAVLTLCVCVLYGAVLGQERGMVNDLQRWGEVCCVLSALCVVVGWGPGLGWVSMLGSIPGAAGALALLSWCRV